MTIATLISDDCVTLKDAFITVDIDGVYTQGCTVCDFKGLLGKPNGKVSVNLDCDKFVDLMKQACAKLN